MFVSLNAFFLGVESGDKLESWGVRLLVAKIDDNVALRAMFSIGAIVDKLNLWDEGSWCEIRWFESYKKRIEAIFFGGLNVWEGR